MDPAFLDPEKKLNIRQKQSLFAYLFAKLILHAYELGYEITLGEAWRSEAEALRLAKTGAGAKKSLHIERMAADINLFRGGIWLTRSDDHKALGAYWKSLHPLCRWGGDFKPPAPPDGNHYSLYHDGRA